MWDAHHVFVLPVQGPVAAGMRALEPEGGASGAGEAICRYVRDLRVGTPRLAQPRASGMDCVCYCESMFMLIRARFPAATPSVHVKRAGIWHARCYPHSNACLAGPGGRMC